ncbi:hypothetical protein DM02DRAFT_631742 [Periconia macrospinosa]|uniref:F-box domain-containing protein n=1 Tax=Periconia macrospinosa TaxID=97972 RepID=A0A2V1DFB4_9PLEO|nr:hypothetical protein DM02DRAFT_631742 [Periconia macrospinosa]
MAHTPPLLRLPNELLFKIANHLTQSTHTRAIMRALSLTCRRLRPIGQEVLITNPEIDIYRIHMYMYVLDKNKELMPKIKVLELSSEEPPPHKLSPLLAWTRVMKNPSILSPQMLKFCLGLQQRMQQAFGAGAVHTALANVQNWENVLEECVIPAILCVLWGFLPNLKQFKVTGAKIVHIRWLIPAMLVRPVFSPDQSLVFSWVSKLEVMEFPENVDHYMPNYAQPPNPWGFHHFHALKVLSIPMKMLIVQPFPQGTPAQVRQRRIIGLKIFPQTLECLRVTAADPNSGGFLEQLRLERNQGRFAQFRRLELYFQKSLGATRKLAARHGLMDPWNEYWLLSSSIQIELFLCFPGRMEIDIDTLKRTVWALRDAGELAPAKDAHWVMTWLPVRLEGEWDADGDFTMTDTPELPEWASTMLGHPTIRNRPTLLN